MLPHEYHEFHDPKRHRRLFTKGLVMNIIIKSSFYYGTLNIHIYALCKQTSEWVKFSSHSPKKQYSNSNSSDFLWCYFSLLKYCFCLNRWVLRSFLNVSTCVLMVLPSFFSTLLRERRESGSLFHCTGPYALSPMVFKFNPGSLSRSVSLEYLLLYCDYVFIDRSSFRYDGPIPTRHLKHRLMLVNFHRKCIAEAEKAQWDRGIT